MAHSRITAFFDLDGTLIAASSERRCYATLARQYGVWFRVRSTVAWVMRSLWGLLRGEALYDAMRNRQYLRGVLWSEVEQVAQGLKDELQASFFAQARERLDWHQQQGHSIVVISASLKPLVEAVMEPYAVHEVIACTLPLNRQQRILGTEQGGIIPRRRNKADFVHDYAKKHAVDLAQCWAYGNTAADGFFMQCCGQAVAVNPDKGLRRMAQSAGWVCERWA